MSYDTGQEAGKIGLAQSLAECTGRLDSLVRDLLKHRLEEARLLDMQLVPEIKFPSDRNDRLRTTKTDIAETEDSIDRNIGILEKLWRANKRC